MNKLMFIVKIKNFYLLEFGDIIIVLQVLFFLRNDFFEGSVQKDNMINVKKLFFENN